MGHPLMAIERLPFPVTSWLNIDIAKVKMTKDSSFFTITQFAMFLIKEFLTSLARILLRCFTLTIFLVVMDLQDSYKYCAFAYWNLNFKSIFK